MKKLISLLAIVFVSSLSFVSCSSEKEDANIDPIIGTWYAFSENGKELSDCEKKSFTTFSADGKVKGANYLEEDGECTMLESDIKGESTTIWKNENGKYIVTISVKDEDGNVGEMKITFKSLVFSDNNKTMTTTNDNGEGDGGVYVLVYKKK